MQAYKDLVKALPGLKEDMPRAFYMLAELFDYGSFDICSCLLYTSPSPRDRTRSRMPSSA